MRTQLQRLLDAHDGVVSWRDACEALSPGVVEWASRTGQVRRPFPGVIADPAVPAQTLLPRAALLVAGPGAALSHTTALAVWRLPVPHDRGDRGDRELIHVKTDLSRHISTTGIIVHRRQGFLAEAPAVLVRRGLRVTNLESSIIDSWPLQRGTDQRAPSIMAVAERMTTTGRLRAALDSTPRLPRRRELAALLDLLTAGCRSPLELWGHRQVLTGAGFERLRWAVPVTVGSRTYWLDTYDESSATNFELDGAAFHSSPGDSERDRRRDATLATVGIMTVRFSHRRLTQEPGAVRQEARSVMALRRLHGAGDASAPYLHR